MPAPRKAPAAVVKPSDAPSTAPAAAAEATWTDELVVQYDGQTYTIPRANLSSIAFHEAVQDGKDVVMIRELLGPVQWTLFKDKHTARTDIMAFAESFGAVAGTGN